MEFCGTCFASSLRVAEALILPACGSWGKAWVYRVCFFIFKREPASAPLPITLRPDYNHRFLCVYELQSAVGISFLSILWFLFYFLNYKFLKAKTMPQLLWSCAMKSNSEDSGDTIPSVNSLPRLVFWLVATMMGLLGLLQDFYLQWAAIY